MNPWRKSSHSHGGCCVEVAWRKSSHSRDDACVEVKHGTTTAVIRDSKNPTAAHLTIPGSTWAAFLSGIRADHFRP